MVSSKTKSPETLGTLRKEDGSPWVCIPVAGLWSFLSTDRHSPGLGFPPQHPPQPSSQDPSLPNLQIPHVTPGLLREDLC